jgi:hypothetical protein
MEAASSLEQRRPCLKFQLHRFSTSEQNLQSITSQFSV